ncbi:GMC oxidoreductase, partial [Crenobacter sp. SG2305]|uniref:GMC oxidoreductase n=1 Tax=Crenobacter oryzisoli TaxID=3056844 RepID=UPI0025AB23D9
TSIAYLDQAKDRDNLTVHTRALADRILFNGKRAIGVAYLQGDTPREARARREVIVSNGAIASPQLLLRSGVGNADELSAMGIDPVIDLKGVGENLQDHLEMYLQYECTKPVSLYPALKWWNKPAIGIEWYVNGTGTGASNHFEAGGFIRSSDEFAWPNLQYHFIPLAMNYDGSNPVQSHGFQCHVGSMRSPSTGFVKLASRDPRVKPRLLFNYMAHDVDWREFRAGIRITREIIAQQAMDQFRGREIKPGMMIQSDAEIDEFVRTHAETALHPSCTCKMGDASDPEAVVDNQGRVHGLSGLRVVDASIMPRIVTGNLNAPTIMMAEKLADVIRGRAPLARSSAPYYKAGGVSSSGQRQAEAAIAQ